MFYIKIRLGEDTTLRTEITDENTYTTCIDCGDEIQIDLDEVIVDGHLDLFGLGIRCDACSRKYALQHRGEPWAEQVLMEK